MNKISEKAVWDELVTSEDEKMSPTSFGQPALAQMMFCYKCNQIIPADARFCPWCQTELFVTCPKCEKKYSSQWNYCPFCGVNEAEYLKRKELIQKEIELNSPQILDFSWEKLDVAVKFTWHTKNATECFLRIRRLDTVVFTVIEQCPPNGSLDVWWTRFSDEFKIFEGEVEFAIELACYSEKYPPVYNSLYLRIKIPLIFGTWEVHTTYV